MHREIRVGDAQLWVGRPCAPKGGLSVSNPAAGDATPNGRLAHVRGPRHMRRSTLVLLRFLFQKGISHPTQLYSLLHILIFLYNSPSSQQTKRRSHLSASSTPCPLVTLSPSPFSPTPRAMAPHELPLPAPRPPPSPAPHTPLRGRWRCSRASAPRRPRDLLLVLRRRSR
jgi:hypothetical protein